MLQQHTCLTPQLIQDLSFNDIVSSVSVGLKPCVYYCLEMLQFVLKQYRSQGGSSSPLSVTNCEDLKT